MSCASFLHFRRFCPFTFRVKEYNPRVTCVFDDFIERLFLFLSSTVWLELFLVSYLAPEAWNFTRQKRTHAGHIKKAQTPSRKPGLSMFIGIF